MPKIICPSCGCGAHIASDGETSHLLLGDPPDKCPKLRHRLDAGENIKNLLVCQEMAAEASDLLLKPARPNVAVDPGAEDPLALWRDANHSRRAFLREPIKHSARLASDGTRRACALQDLSPVGALVSLQDSDGIETGTFVALTPEGYRTIPAEVRHVDHHDDTAGLMLLHGPADQVALAQWFASRGAALRTEFCRAV